MVSPPSLMDAVRHRPALIQFGWVALASTTVISAITQTIVVPTANYHQRTRRANLPTRRINTDYGHILGFNGAFHEFRSVFSDTLFYEFVCAISVVVRTLKAI